MARSAFDKIKAGLEDAIAFAQGDSERGKVAWAKEGEPQMTSKWPSFVTKDLPDTDAGDAEMMRRWEAYDRDMQALIAAGGVHQDDDGWWVDDATGELIGPDPEIERPLTADELAQGRPFKEALPELYESIQRSRHRLALDGPKKAKP